jgi:exopolysaccharide biosynthesis WecB/TagA/CpsF family protein
MHRTLAAVLQRHLPRLRVAGFWAPERSVVDDPVASAELARSIGRTEVDVLVVGLGKPRQEKWIAHHARRTNARVCLAFGAAPEFLAGTASRAPRAVQVLCGEWLYRLLLEPRRLWRRYLVEGPRAIFEIVRSREVEAGTGP